MPPIEKDEIDEVEVDEHDEVVAGEDDESADSDADEDGDGGEDGDDDSGSEGTGAVREDRGEETRDSRPVKRGANDVVREAKRRAKEAEERAEALDRRARDAERRAEEAERARQDRRTAESAETEAARVALMTDAERFEHYRAKDKQESDQRFNSLRFENWEREDRRDFRDLCRNDPLVAQVRDKVEAEYDRLKRTTGPVSRELIANQEIAKMVRERRAKAGTKQRKAGEESVRRETTKPARARSDVGSTRTRRGQEDTPEARRARLADVII